jgi:hypothetical protein
MIPPWRSARLDVPKRTPRLWHSAPLWLLSLDVLLAAGTMQ